MKNAVGVIGGLGAMAGAYYLKRVFEFTDVDKDQDHINIMLYSHATIVDRTAYILGKSSESPLPDLLADVHIMEALGCEFVTIACNTAQYFYEYLQENVGIPVVNIVEETIKFVVKNYASYRNIGILATDGTLETKIYQTYLEKNNLKPIIPSKEEQAIVMSIIYDTIKKGNRVNENDFETMINTLRERGAQKIILGCTELSVAKGELNYHAPDVLDALDVLAYETVRRRGKKVIHDVFSKF